MNSQSATAGTASTATWPSTCSGSSEEASTALLSDRKRWARSARLWLVMSSITLIAIATRPSRSMIGVAFTADQRSSPVSRTRNRTTTSLRSPAASAVRPGSWSTGNGCPPSSSISKRSRIAGSGADSSSSLDSKPSSSTAASLANSSRPSGACAVTASATPLRMASSWSRASVASRRASCSSRSSSSRSLSARRRSVMSRTVPVNIGGSLSTMRLIASSTGNSLPSARMPVSSTRWPSRVDSPVSTVRRSARRWRSRRDGGHDQLRQLGADRLARRVPEHPLGGRVELEHAAAVVDRDHAVERRREHGGLARLARAHRAAGAQARGEVADQRPHRAQELEQARVRLALGAGEELDHPHAFPAAEHRERHAAVQPGALRRLAAQEVARCNRVLDEGSACRCPRPARAGRARAGTRAGSRRR